MPIKLIHPEYFNLFTNTHVGIVYCSIRSKTIVDANPAFCRIIDEHRENIVGRKLSNFTSSLFLSEYFLQQLIDKGSSDTIRVTLKNKKVIDIQTFMIGDEFAMHHIVDRTMESYLLDENRILVKVIDSITDKNKKELSLEVLARFSRTEREIYLELRNGKTSKQICEKLNIKKSTLATHRRNIRKKLNLNGKDITLREYLQQLN